VGVLNQSGLPSGILGYQKLKFWSMQLFECLVMETFGIFYGHLVYFMATWYVLWSFGIFYDHLVYFMVTWDVLWSFGIFYDHLV
jgi:hypothetical protein